ncbi:MAG: NADH-quinone oxidoreductase subunit J [Gammaproteobacteria bacterium]|nr:MAG: NADH-quinone oxidoreductase subunit J [Gammaproteobacteria bacterium]
MSAEQIIFYIFASILTLSALGVITARNPVHAVLLLVLAFFTSAALWLLLEAEFLAITLVLVYVGAVMVLFLFVVMMLDINITRMREGFARYLPLGMLVALVIAFEMALVLGPQHFGLERVPAPMRHTAGYSNTAELGSVLYTVYLYPFEIAAAILLVAIVAAIALTLRKRTQNTRYQNPGEQVLVRREDRVRIVKMLSEQEGKRS